MKNYLSYLLLSAFIFTLSSSTLQAENIPTNTINLFYHHQVLMQRVNKAYAAISFGVARKYNEEQLEQDAQEIASNLADLEIYAPTQEIRKSVKTLELLWANHYSSLSRREYNKTGIHRMLVSNEELLEASQDVENQILAYSKEAVSENEFSSLELITKIGQDAVIVQRIAMHFFAHLVEVDYNNVAKMSKLIIAYEQKMTELMEATAEMPDINEPLLKTLIRWQTFEDACTKREAASLTGTDFNRASGGSMWISVELEKIMTIIVDRNTSAAR